MRGRRPKPSTVLLGFALSVFAGSHLWPQSTVIQFQGQASFPVSVPGDSLSPSTGGGARFAVEYQLPWVPFLHAAGCLDYTATYLPTFGLLSLMSAGGGGGAHVDFANSLRLSVTGVVGYYLGTSAGMWGGSLMWGLDAAASYPIGGDLSVGLGCGYTEYLSGKTSLFRGLTAQLGVSYSPSPRNPRPKLEIVDLELASIFPVNRKYFDSNPLGKVTFRNGESGPIEGVKVSFFLPSFMDAPRLCVEIP